MKNYKGYDHGRGFNAGMLALINDRRQNHTPVYSRELGEKLADKYWTAICEELSRENIASCDSLYTLVFLRFDRIGPIEADCERILKDLDKKYIDWLFRIIMPVASLIVSIIALYNKCNCG